jgi:hypothetical protein
MLLAVAIVTGCQATLAQRPHGARMLTGAEMDTVTAGSAVAASDAAARARGTEAQTDVLGSASAYSGLDPIPGPTFLNYANSQATASASGDALAATGLTSSVSVDGANGGASITATASGVGTSRAQVTAQFYGTSITRADLAYGSVAASACCGSGSEAQVRLDTATGGPYSKELRATPVSGTPSQAASRIDVTVISSTLPILDPAQVVVTGVPTRVDPRY